MKSAGLMSPAEMKLSLIRRWLLIWSQQKRSCLETGAWKLPETCWEPENAAMLCNCPSNKPRRTCRKPINNNLFGKTWHQSAWQKQLERSCGRPLTYRERMKSHANNWSEKSCHVVEEKHSGTYRKTCNINRSEPMWEHRDAKHERGAWRQATVENRQVTSSCDLAVNQSTVIGRNAGEMTWTATNWFPAYRKQGRGTDRRQPAERNRAIISSEKHVRKKMASGSGTTPGDLNWPAASWWQAINRG